MADLPVRAIELTPELEARLLRVVDESCTQSIEEYNERRETYVEWRRAYKANPKEKVKNFPWPNSSNVVIPLIGMSCDAIVARLFRAMLGAKDFCEVEIKSKQWETVELPPAIDPATGMPGPPQTLSLEKELRDWITYFMHTSNSRDRVRTLIADVALYGEGFVQPRWSDETRIYHNYDAQGNVVELPVPEYSGVRWDIPAPDDVIPPNGFDEWGQLPYVILELRYTWEELLKLKETGQYRNINELGSSFLKESGKSLTQDKAKTRDDPRYIASAEELGGIGPAQIFTLYEIKGKWPIYTVTADGESTKEVLSYEECILTWSKDYNLFIRTIYNPFFGKSRFVVRVPFLVVPHELHGSGIAEQALQFQEEASTAHNQVIDSGTLANAPVVVTTPDANYGNNQEIFPGKRIVTDKPKDDINVVHLGANSSVLGTYEDKAIRYGEARTGVSPYHLGMESTVVGSRATATGTTALISEGNLRFAMSIDDMRHSIEECLYLTIQLEQQMRPAGHEWAPGRFIQFPPGDVRTSLGLKLSLTSEKINRDIEIQNLMLLMQVLNDYYMRLMQAAALISNPMFPPAHKIVATAVMDASQAVIKRFVERFDIEDIDAIVPGLMDTINMAMRIVNGIPGLAQAPAGLPAGGSPQGAPGGSGAPAPEASGGGPPA